MVVADLRRVRRWLLCSEPLIHGERLRSDEQPAEGLSGWWSGGGMEASEFAQELSQALAGRRVVAEDAVAVNLFLGALFSAVGQPPPFQATPLQVLFRILVPGIDQETDEIIEAAEYWAHSLCPDVPHLANATGRAMEMLLLVAGQIEIATRVGTRMPRRVGTG